MCCGKGKTPLCYPKQNMCMEQSRSSKRLFAFTHLSKSKKTPSCECDLNKDKVTCEVPALDDTKIASHLLLLSFLSKKPWNYLAQPMICRIKQPLQLHIIFSLCSHECPPMCLWSRRSMSVIWCLAANVGFWGMCGLCWVQEGRADGRICFFSWKGTGWCICLSSGHSVHIKGFIWNKQESSKASYFTKNFYD